MWKGRMLSKFTGGNMLQQGGGPGGFRLSSGWPDVRDGSNSSIRVRGDFVRLTPRNGPFQRSSALQECAYGDVAEPLIRSPRRRRRKTGSMAAPHGFTG